MDPTLEQLIKNGVMKPLKSDQHENYYAIGGARALTELLLPLNPQGHKGTFGHVLVTEGHENFKGASRLVALSALRVGAGLVTLLSKDQLYPHPNDLFEFMKMKESDLSETFLKKISAMVIGPGLSKDPTLQNWALNLLLKAAPLVPTIIIDADGLALLEHLKPNQVSATLICTPHPQEAATLLHSSVVEVERDRLAAIMELSQLPVNAHCTIIWLLKGSTSLVSMPKAGIFAIDGNTPLLATGGSGDILAGAIAGLIKQSSSPLDATLLATTLMIACARESTLNADRGILPSELASRFPYLLKRTA